MSHHIPCLVMKSGLPAAKVLSNAVDSVDLLGVTNRAISFNVEEIDRRSLYATTPYADTEHFAESKLGMDRRRCREYVKAGKRLLILTILDTAYLEGRIHWSSLKRILTVVTVDTQEAWVKYAEEHTYAEVSSIVKRCKQGQLPHEASDFGTPDPTMEVHFKFSSNDATLWELLRTKLSKGLKEPLRDGDLQREMMIKLHALPDEEGLEEVDPEEPEPAAPRPLPLDERNHEELPKELEQDIRNRDKHECQNCRTHYRLHVHHILPREYGGDNGRSNLILVCIRCHGTIHAGNLIVVGDPERRVTFTDKSGNPLHRSGWDPSRLPIDPATRVAPPHMWQNPTGKPKQTE